MNPSRDIACDTDNQARAPGHADEVSLSVASAAPSGTEPSPTSAPKPSTTAPRRHSSVRRDAPPPVHPPDVVSFFDPASIGGGGPLRRLSTKQRERSEAEALERAAREAAGVPDGILNRFRSASISTSRPGFRPTFITPLKDEGETGTAHRYAPTLSPTWSSKTLAGMSETEGKEKERDRPTAPPSEAGGDEEEHHYPDGGYGWVVLCACIVLAGVTMGFGMTWGIFQAYYSTLWPEASSVYLSSAGTTTPLFMSAMCFFSGRMGDRFGFKRVLYASAIISWIGMFCAAFSTEIWHVMLSQGILTGIGQGLAVPLFMSLPSQWFYKHRGFASGAAIGGAGLGGGFATLIVRQMLLDLGNKRTLIILSFVNLVLTAGATALIRTRPSAPEAQGGGGPWIDKAVMSTARFWAITLSLGIAVLGYAMPYTWLPQWVALNLPHLDPKLSALPSTLLGFSVCVGRALAGLSADHIGPLNTYLLVFLLTGIITTAVWLTAESFAHICAFGVLFGIVGPGFMGMIPQIVVQIFGPQNLATNVGFLLLANAPGNFVSGPLGGALYDMTGRTDLKWVVVCGACASFVGCLFATYARFATDSRLFARV